MDYKISTICSDLGIGKSTLYKRIEILKQSIPESDWKKNDYFYYTDNNKLFFTDKGFAFIRDFKTKNDNIRQDSNSVILCQNQIIDIYKNRIEYLESENKRLLDIISLKEQKELAKDINYISSSNTSNSSGSFWSKFTNFFRK